MNALDGTTADRPEVVTRVRVLIVDDHAVVRRGIRAYLEVLDDLEVAAEAADGQEALEGLESMAAHSELPDVVLIDLLMPRMDGVVATSRITERFPGVRVVVLTSFGEMERVHAALANGASATCSRTRSRARWSPRSGRRRRGTSSSTRPSRGS